MRAGGQAPRGVRPVPRGLMREAGGAEATLALEGGSSLRGALQLPGPGRASRPDKGDTYNYRPPLRRMGGQSHGSAGPECGGAEAVVPFGPSPRRDLGGVPPSRAPPPVLPHPTRRRGYQPPLRGQRPRRRQPRRGRQRPDRDGRRGPPRRVAGPPQRQLGRLLLAVAGPGDLLEPVGARGRHARSRRRLGDGPRREPERERGVRRVDGSPGRRHGPFRPRLEQRRALAGGRGPRGHRPRRGRGRAGGGGRGGGGGGELQCVWGESGTGPEAILSANSLDGGASWSLAQVTPSSGTTPVFTPDVTAVTGTIYATWISQGQVRIVRSSRSVDGGATWSAPVRADDVPTAFADAFPEDPKVAVVLGNPYIVWDDIRSTLRDLYVSGSSDGGTTWGDCPAPCWPNNDIRVDDSVVADTQRHPDTASSAAGLYAVWEDDRTGSTDIYFARHVISDVLVTELRDGPDAAEEVVEIAVYSETPVDFAGWDLVVDGTWYPLGGLGVVPGWELRTVGNWPSADLVLGGFAVGDVYGNEGGTIQVRDDIGALEDEIRYGQLGRAPDPIPGASTSRRIVGLAYSNEWTLDVTPTFGTPNDSGRVLAQPAVILNEILYDATVPGTRFIEVRLRGGAPLNTTGYRVVGDAVFTIPAASGETLTPANPEGQVVNAAAPFLFASLGPPGDNLYLYDPAWNLLDEVGWSTAHPVDTSVCRVPDGAGTFASFNDPTAVTARWQFGCAPPPPQIGLAPSPQVGRGDRGDVVRFSLTVTNKQAVPDSTDLAAATAPNGWLVEFYDAADATPLADGPDPGTDPETSLLGVDEAEDITVRGTVPAGIPAQDSESIT